MALANAPSTIEEIYRHFTHDGDEEVVLSGGEGGLAALSCLFGHVVSEWLKFG